MIIDRSKNYSRYFRAYIDAHQIRDGAEVDTRDYISWIGQQHRLFRDLKKLPKDRPHPPELQGEFEEFIGLEVQNESL